MTERLRLKPWIEPVSLDKVTSILLSETTSHTLNGELLVAVLGLLDGTRNEDDIADALSDRFNLSEIFYQLIQLKKKGFIEAVPVDEPSSKRVFYEQLGGDSLRLDKPQPVRVTAVGGMSPQPVAHFLSRMESFQVDIAGQETEPSDTDALWIVVTPDYLEPDLERFNLKTLDTATRWLPFKPHGIEPWIGPLIEPGKSACIECLLHRLRGHRALQVRCTHEKGRPLRLSQGLTDASLETACGLLVLELEKILFKSPHAFIQKGTITINLKTLETRHHELVRRPCCPACGEKSEGSLGGLPKTVLSLSSRPKAAYNDGGQRIKAAAKTMKLFEARISPITGEVGALEPNEKVPEFFGHLVTSSWCSLKGLKRDMSKGRFHPVGTSSGKGRSEIQARTSALGEALERYSSQYFGHEMNLRAAYSDISDRALHPLELNPFSENQYNNREAWAERAETGRVPERFDDDAPIDWTPVWSLTRNEWRWAPSAFIYHAYPGEGGGKYCHGDSNGVAAGNCMEEAIMQGLFELVERDGVALWWYNRLQRPALDLRTFGSTLALDAAEGLRRNHYTLHVLDLTTDLGIPVFAAVGLHGSDSGAEPILGFGSHFDPRIALDRAISETGQSWALREHMSPNEINRKTTGRSLSAELFLRPPESTTLTPFSTFTNKATEDFLKDLESCVSILDDLGLELLVADLSRPEVGLSVVRAIVPGLVHFWPRFAAARLYDVPVKLGWVNGPRTEEDLNPVPFYF